MKHSYTWKECQNLGEIDTNKLGLIGSNWGILCNAVMLV